MAKSQRTLWCEFSKKEREHIYKRDRHRCIVCGSNSFLGIAHAYLPRSQGGVGNRMNGVLLCQKCHNALDSYGANKLYDIVKNTVDRYLTRLYGEVNMSKLKYDKFRYMEESYES